MEKIKVLCTKCGQECGEEEYKVHAENGCKTLRCQQCSEYFTNKNSLNKHIRAIHNKEYECSICKKEFGCKYSLQKHQFLKHKVIYNKKKAQHCENCGEVFAGKYFLKQHIQKMHTTELVCSICQFKFASIFNLRKHLLLGHDSKGIAANEPEISKVPKTECSKCGELIATQFLKRHLRARHSQSSFAECPKCGELIAKRDLRRHLREKHGPSFACHVCGKQYLSEKTLQNHIERHKQGGQDIKEEVILKKKYECHLCPRKCTAAWNLRAHLKAIHGEILKKKYKCHLCTQKYMATKDLKKHLKARHGQQFNCKVSKILLTDSETENSETKSKSSEEDSDIDDDLPLASLKLSKTESTSSEEDSDIDDDLPLASLKVSKTEPKSCEEDYDTDNELTLAAVEISKTEPKSFEEDHYNDEDSSDYDELPLASVEIKMEEEEEENNQKVAVQQTRENVSIAKAAEYFKHNDELPIVSSELSIKEEQENYSQQVSNDKIEVKSIVQPSVLCTKCGQSCGEDEYRVHIENDCQTLRCAQCPQFFKTERALLTHIRAVHDREFQCTICKIDFSCKYNLQTHQFLKHKVIYNEKKAQKCDTCGEVFAGKKFLRMHIQKAHTTELVCNICNFKFASIFTLRKHMLRGHNDEEMSTNGQENNKHTKTACPKCGKLIDKRYLERHLRLKCSQNLKNLKFKCNVCEKECSSEYTLKRHQESHRKKESLTCHLCEKEFSSQKAFKKHNDFRHGEDISEEILLKKKYKCHLCSQRFTASWTLKTHMKARHEGQYKCEICEKLFSAPFPLTRHRLNVHGLHTANEKTQTKSTTQEDQDTDEDSKSSEELTKILE